MPATSPSPTLLVVATGGTIGMRDTGAGLSPDPEFPAALDAMLAEVTARLGARVRVNHLSPAIDSANADADTAPRIARAVRARIRTHRPRGVVITHGTDTLAHTAARLAFELADEGAPVVVTGSQFPHTDPARDATANLALAASAALRANPQAPVAVAFGGALLPAVRATKFDTDAREGFRAERPLGASAEGLGEVGPDAARESDPPSPGRGSAAARVVSFRFVPGTTAADLRATVAAKPDGLVLECTGAGNAPMAKPGMADAIAEACAALPVVAITQCARGGVDLDRYAVGRELAAVGVMDGGDMTLEAALAKLGFALDRGASGETLRRLIARNLVGERTP